MKKSSRVTGLMAAAIGATFLLMILTNPRVEALHFPDVVKLVASGMFLGFGFAGLGEGGDQAAPLGRAVVGGLAGATLATLFILPAVFALIQGRASTDSASLDPDDAESRHFGASTA